MYFAVKTCGKFHKDRIPVVKNTWARYTAYIGFYSEVEDSSIPTINLGIPNTEHGHCGKTMAIFKHIAETSDDVRWAIIVDDDTIISVARLQQYLSCFDADKPIAIGERYGYNVMHSPEGYNYITGGGGMARPLDYAPEYLAPQHVVSFHKHWMIDPHKVYEKWFSRVDQEMESQLQGRKHVEL
ncbi:Beta-1 [Blattella germanica]|nr:Beta-1 [Blattella germanica]